MVLQEDKSPFMPAMLPWSAEQSQQNSTELEGNRAPGPPRQAALPTPMCLEALARSSDSEQPLTHSILMPLHQGHHQHPRVPLRREKNAMVLCGVDCCPTAEHPQSSWCRSAHQQQLTSCSAGSSPTDRQMDRGMDGGMDVSPQLRAQPQPLQAPAVVSELAEGPW